MERENKYMNNFHQRLRFLRKSNNMKQKELAKLLYMDRTTLSGYETNRRYPNAYMLVRVADIFDVSVDYLLGRCEK